MTRDFDISRARAAGLTAFGRWINFSIDEDRGGLLYALGFQERHIGNPGIRSIHGGVVSSFLELAAQAELSARLRGAPLATATFSIDFMASTRAADMKARARLDRLGRRVAFLEARAWQESEDRPVAAARICIRIAPLAEKSTPAP